MKKTIIFFFVLLGLIGCEKEDIVCLELKGRIVILNYDIPAIKPDKYGFVIKYIKTGQIGCLELPITTKINDTLAIDSCVFIYTFKIKPQQK